MLTHPANFTPSHGCGCNIALALLMIVALAFFFIGTSVILYLFVDFGHGMYDGLMGY